MAQEERMARLLSRVDVLGSLSEEEFEDLARMMDLLAERLSQSNERMAEIARKGVLSRLPGQVLRMLEDEGATGCRTPTPTRNSAR